MIPLFKTNYTVGVDVTSKGIYAVFLAKEKRATIVSDGGGVLPNHVSLADKVAHPIADGVVRPLFKTPNILDAEQFGRELKVALGTCGVKRGKIGLSLPNETVKVMLRRFSALPESPIETEKMIRWNLTQTLKTPLEHARIVWERMGKDGQGRHVLLIQFAWEAAVCQYERAIEKAGFTPVLILSAPVALFNLIAERVPSHGGSLCLIQHHSGIVLFASMDGIPFYIKNINTGYLRGGDLKDDSRTGGQWAVDEIEMAVKCYKAGQFDDVGIESAIVIPRELTTPFDDGVFHYLNKKRQDDEERKAVETIFTNCNPLKVGEDAVNFAAALGAAKSVLFI